MGVFIAFNLAAFLFIMAAYIAIIVKVSKSQRRVKAHGESDVSSNSIKRESALARRVFAIILTDFSCWVPVIILSILALTGQFYDEHGFVYVWFAVFVLPVNSSVNPVLYTFSTPKVRQFVPMMFLFFLPSDAYICTTPYAAYCLSFFLFKLSGEKCPQKLVLSHFQPMYMPYLQNKIYKLRYLW